MGVNRFIATAIRRVKQEIDRSTPDNPRTGLDGPVNEPIDPLEVARRQRERSRFADDASYFEFLIDRAIHAGAGGS